MRVAVLGAGVCGLAAAHRLTQAGHVCDVYERWPGLGGQAATLDVGDGVRIERYYHHLFTSDRDIRALYDELGMPDEIEWRTSTTAFVAGGRLWPFTTPGDLLRFKPLPPLTRVRMGAAVLALQRFGREAAPYERLTAREWISTRMGRPAWDVVWGPLLRGKFGERADDISMVWLWSKFHIRRDIKGDQARVEKLGYPRGTWEGLFRALVRSVTQGGGRVLEDRPARSVSRDADGGFVVEAAAPGSFRAGHDPQAFAPDGEPERYDAVLATVPTDVFERLLDPALAAQVDADGYLRRARSIEYFTALVVLLELDRPFSRFYWTNVADRDLPFVGLIEQTNWVEPAHYGGRRFLYVSNYFARGHEWLSWSLDELLDRYEPGLRRVVPEFSRAWIRHAWRFVEPAGQPIVTVGYRERMPALRTPVERLLLANTTQVYPEDRGTNYAVRLGERAARALLG